MGIKVTWIGDQMFRYQTGRLNRLRRIFTSIVRELTESDEPAVITVTSASTDISGHVSFINLAGDEIRSVHYGLGFRVEYITSGGTTAYTAYLLASGLALSNASGDSIQVIVDNGPNAYINLEGQAGAHARFGISGATLDFVLEGLPTADQVDGKTIWSNAGVLTLSS